MRQLRVFGVLFAVVGGLGICSLLWVHAVRAGRRDACLWHQRQIYAAMNSAGLAYATSYHVGDTLPVDLICDSLPRCEFPRCPSGGFYVVPPLGGLPRCSYHGCLMPRMVVDYLEQIEISPKATVISDDGGLLLDLSDSANIDPCILADLAGWGVNELCLDRTEVASLRPLFPVSAVATYTSLSLVETRVKDLTPLKQTALKNLRIQKTLVTDLSPLEEVNLVRISFDPDSITNGLDVLQDMESLEFINGQPVRAFWGARGTGL